MGPAILATLALETEEKKIVMSGMSLADGMARSILVMVMLRRKGARRAAWACMSSCICLSLIYKGNAAISSCSAPMNRRW